MSDDFNPTDLNALEQQREAQRKQSKFELSIELEDLRWLMSSKRGRRFMWRVLSYAGIYRQSFEGNANWSIFAEGKRSIALRLVDQIHSIYGGAELYAQMTNEAKVKEKPNG